MSFFYHKWKSSHDYWIEIFNWIIHLSGGNIGKSIGAVDLTCSSSLNSDAAKSQSNVFNVNNVVSPTNAKNKSGAETFTAQQQNKIGE